MGKGRGGGNVVGQRGGAAVIRGGGYAPPPSAFAVNPYFGLRVSGTIHGLG